METTLDKHSEEWTRTQAQERYLEERRRVDELATLSAHLSAATARMLELVWTMHENGDVDGGELAGFLAFRCGLTGREAREYLRVAEALQELPATRAAFRARGATVRASSGYSFG